MKTRYILLSVILGLGLNACVHRGPPLPHAPLLHDFYFYPGVGVYYHIDSGYYYYLDGTVWVKVKVLPPRIRIGPRNRVHLRHKTLTPYKKHSKHRKKYLKKRRERPDEAQSRREREENNKRHRRYKKNRK